MMCPESSWVPPAEVILAKLDSVLPRARTQVLLCLTRKPRGKSKELPGLHYKSLRNLVMGRCLASRWETPEIHSGRRSLLASERRLSEDFVCANQRG